VCAMPEPRGRLPMPGRRGGPPKNERGKKWDIKGVLWDVSGSGGGNVIKNCLNPGLGPEPRRRGGPPSRPVNGTGRWYYKGGYWVFGFIIVAYGDVVLCIQA